MSGINKVILIGNLVRDPELRSTQTGKSLAAFSLATNEKYKEASGKSVEKTEFHNCVAWGQAGEIICKYIKKGSKLYVDGKLQTDKFTDKSGQTKYTTKIVVSNFQFLDSKPHSATTISQTSMPQKTPDWNQPVGQGIDDIPF